MKLQELNKEELTQINGGGLLGSNDTGRSSGLSLRMGTDSLLSITIETKKGDHYQKASLSVGNDIALNLGGIFQRLGY